MFKVSTMCVFIWHPVSVDSCDLLRAVLLLNISGMCIFTRHPVSVDWQVLLRGICAMCIFIRHPVSVDSCHLQKRVLFRGIWTMCTFFSIFGISQFMSFAGWGVYNVNIFLTSGISHVISSARVAPRCVVICLCIFTRHPVLVYIG